MHVSVSSFGEKLERGLVKKKMGGGYHSLAPGIGPSVLAADLSRLAEECAALQPFLTGKNDYLHLDVMDGHFVSNITFGAPVIKCLRKHTTAFFDAHLMVADPANWVDDMADAGVDRLTFHIEVVPEPQELIDSIKAAGMGVGIALRPCTPVEAVLEWCSQLDLLLVMTVEPGFGGQAFISETMKKVETVRSKFPTLHIEVDGGINEKTVDIAAAAGANLIVAGTYIFKGDSRKKIATLRRSVEMHGNGKPEDELSPLPK
jgi:ribulose-phosphate 3-epimerase